MLSPGIWVKVFGFSAAIFPYDSPALFSMPIGFLGCLAGSLLWQDAAEADAYDGLYVRSQTGIGAEGALMH